MKNIDIITPLILTIPKYTDKFTSEQNVKSVVKTGTSFALTFDDALTKMEVGNNININNIKTINPCSGSTESGKFFFTTLNKTDITKDMIGQKIKFRNSTTDALVEIELVSLVDLRKFQIKTELPSGYDQVIENRQYWQGLKEITVISVDKKTITIQDDNYILEPFVDGTTVDFKYRIKAVASNDDLIDFIDNHESAIKDNLFVVVGPAQADVNFETMSIANDEKSEGANLNKYMIQDLSVYYISKIKNDFSGTDAKDFAEDLRVWLYKALYGLKVGSQFSGKNSLIIPTADETEEYKRGLYIHRYDFQTQFEVTEQDSVDVISYPVNEIDLSLYLQFDDYEKEKKKLTVK